MSKVLAICGIDGSGKSTQLMLIARYLAKKKVRFKYVWFRWTAFFSYPFLAICRLLGYTEWKIIRKSTLKYAERNFHANKAIAKLWTWLFTIDTLIHSILRVTIPAKLGYYILCDRYVPDIMVDLMCDIKNDNLLESAFGKLLLTLIPEEAVIILLDINEWKAYKRKKDISHINYLKERRKLFLKLAHALKILVLDGGMKPEDIHQAVIEKVFKAQFNIRYESFKAECQINY